ncbi:enoyl-CoA hydratase/isomerase family protein [Mycobacterium parascrofulaceum ATCC BAA-614]|uniref:Enoyl-CoA hydratase/isomerase family protein n=1 Tax=Mycobacterium parascrofulaceum ATCC BAA-614 TaxID=525368 RepID=D5P5N3_9MYCO|nr:enoyl-CoA hydratase/isomerase family protein [Mycobacterium parascrofulaceum]EFG78621.1 enoyl-CoA hydratase/isomerase family protein [Mycobacterium parascrofulaceum ATCC BAA-614]
MTVQHGDLRLERHGNVAEIIWAAPKLNLFTPHVAAAFEAILGRLPSDIRALLLRAEGKVFCAGVRVQEFTVMDGRAGTDFSRRLLTLIRRIEQLPIPTVAVVHALNLTIGLELALACDFIWSAENVSMGLVEATVGITPAAGGTQRLVARAGVARATEMVYTGRTYDSSRLLEWGVVDKVLPSDQLLTQARAFADELAAGPTVATAIAKQIIAVARDRGVAAADDITPDLAGPVLISEDAAIGLETMLSQGPGAKPAFVGR